MATVVGMVADGMTQEEILAAYPDLEAEDIREALHYAAEAVRERSLLHPALEKVIAQIRERADSLELTEMQSLIEEAREEYYHSSHAA